jgi:hypothetical protein
MIRVGRTAGPLAGVLATAVAVVAAVGGVADAGSAPKGPTVGGCPVFPASNAWNRDVSHDAVDPRSSTYLSAEARGAAVHLDLGVRASEGYGIPYVTVPRTQKKVPLRFGVDGESYGDESDKGPMPIPASAPIEGGTPKRPDPSDGDRHVIVVQRGTCTLYELYHAVRVRSHGKVTGWRASSAAKWSLRSNHLRHAKWTSADAAGLPILPGLLRHDDVARGPIRHALRVTLPQARSAFMAPARHCGPSSSSSALPYGARLRLKSSFSEKGYTGAALRIVRAMKTYGLIYADQGSPLYVSGTSDPGWSSSIDQIHGRHPIPYSAFQVLKLGPLTRC